MFRLFLISVVAVFALIGCSSGANEDPAKEVAANSEAEETKENVAETNETENDSANAGGDEVEIHLPAEFFEGQSEEEVIESYQEDGIDNITVNDDGSYTITMTKDEQTALLSEMKADINADMGELITAMEIDIIEDIKMNEDATELLVDIDSDKYDGDMEGIVLMDFALFAMPYQIMNGVTEDEFDFEVVLIDRKTGEEIERTSVHDE